MPSLAVRAGADQPRHVPSAMVDRIVGMSAANAIRMDGLGLMGLDAAESPRDRFAARSKE